VTQLGLILVVDGEEVLIGEWLTTPQARASWTRSPLLVFIAEHHMRTDPYLPLVLAMLGDRALDVIARRTASSLPTPSKATAHHDRHLEASR